MLVSASCRNKLFHGFDDCETIQYSKTDSRKEKCRSGPEWPCKPIDAPPEKSALNFVNVGLPMIIWKDGKVREVPA